MTSKEKLISSLKRTIQGDVRSDLMTQLIYSVDASICELAPTLVVLPKNLNDLIQTIYRAAEFHTPVTPRGGATGVAGGCLGDGIIIDTSKYMTRILEFNPSEQYVVCEPGVIQDQLNAFLSPYGFRLGPDTSTGNRATIGGMCATNAAGHHYMKYGSMIDHVLAIEMILANGSVENFYENTSWPGLPELSFYQKFHRSSSGYPLYVLGEKPRNLAKLLIGSEGTLGVFSKIKLRISKTIGTRYLALFPFSSLEAALEAAPTILLHKPIALEWIDQNILEMGRLSPVLAGKLTWLDKNIQSLLIAEFEDRAPSQILSGQLLLSDPLLQEEIWMLRKAGLGLMLSRRSYSRAIGFIEDLAVPPENLASFVRDLKSLLPWKTGIYGHIGDGCLHIRPYVNVTNPKDMEQIFQMMPSIASLVRQYGGVLSGEHGDGLTRSWLNSHFFGEEVYKAMQQVKQAFDPNNLMNPGKIVGGATPSPHFLRTSRPVDVPTVLDFTKEGGLHLAADLCNGNGACRKQEGLMCPSFHAFNDERHTTRARAQSLRSILNGQTTLDALTGKGLLDVLDYCLECKGCKKECPSLIDMAKMKVEMLYQFQEKNGYFFKNILFSELHHFSQMGAAFSPISNWFLTLAQKIGVPQLFGLTHKRPFPRFAKQRFTYWWKERKPKKVGKKIFLFVDTFTEFYHPHVGQAAVSLLEKFGFSIELVGPLCCGRPAFSAGLLKKAKVQAEKLSSVLKCLKEPIVVLEPSCLSMIQDDYASLGFFPKKVFRIEEVLSDLKSDLPIFYHPHCHEQALQSFSEIKKILPNATISQAGCCGMAGSFGYIKNHYEMSMAIAEKDLFPLLRDRYPALPLMVSGFSCREHIAHGLGRSSLHPAEVLLSLC
jgi:FAD/FMN-containing dehydrogenase/Fe-S oxidoreductase